MSYFKILFTWEKKEEKVWKFLVTEGYISLMMCVSVMFASFEFDLFPIGASYSSVSFLGTSFTDVKDETTLRKKIIRL